MKVSIQDKKLIIELDLGEPEKSTSGKSLLIASTHGNQKTDVLVDGKPLVVSVNAYTKAN